MLNSHISFFSSQISLKSNYVILFRIVEPFEDQFYRHEGLRTSELNDFLKTIFQRLALFSFLEIDQA